MTSREEIECLLNQTGRTLEGLPTQDEYWYSDDYVDRNEEIAMMMYRSGFKRNEPYIMYQSDVIELLVGALRDALDKPIQKPLTLEELTKSTYQIPCWIEGHEIELYPDVIDRDSIGMFSKIGTSTAGFTIYCDLETYGKDWRCWASRPTDEEREAAAWER